MPLRLEYNLVVIWQFIQPVRAQPLGQGRCQAMVTSNRMQDVRYFWPARASLLDQEYAT